MTKISVVAGRSSAGLAKGIARELNAELVNTSVRIFADGESKVTLSKKIAKKAIIVQSIYPPVDSNLVQALSLVAKASEDASNVIAVIPYMGYARQDREFLSGEIITMKVLGKLFKGAGASQVLVVDIHSMMGLKHFTIKTKNVSAVPDLARFFAKKDLKEPLVVSPDRGGKDRARKFASILGTKYIALEKQRDKKTGKIKIKTKDASVKGRDLILVDDMISTGGSIIKATQFLKRLECGRIFVACTHALLVNDAQAKLKKAGVVKIVSTNTIPQNTSIVDVSGTIAQALR